MGFPDSIHQQCIEARNVGCWFDHSNWGLIEVSGKDRLSFLHNVLTNDIKSLKPGSRTEACLLTAQATIVAVLNILCCDDFVWLLCDPKVKDRLQKALEKLIIMEQVSLKDRTHEFQLISVHGPQANELISSISNQAPPEKIFRVNLIGEKGYGILFSTKDSASFKETIAEEAGYHEMIEVKEEAMEIMRISAAIPKYGIDYDETNIPLECRLEHTISFTKGCFPGQEIIARLMARGGVSKKLSGMVLKGEATPNRKDRLWDQTIEAGFVTSATYDPILKKTIALGYLKKGSWSSGHLITVETEVGRLPARVEDLPFYSQ